MPRRRTPQDGECVHITVRCNNRAFYFDLQKDFQILLDWLASLPYFFNVSLHHFLFMSNHMHLLLTPRENNLGKAMSYFLTNLSKALNKQQGRINHTFADRYCPTIIKDERHLVNVVRYIYQNPHRARIASDIKKYRYSSLGTYLGEVNHGIKLSPDAYTCDLFNRGTYGRETWIAMLYEYYSTEEVRIIRESLLKSEFKFSRQQKRVLNTFPHTITQ